MQEISQCYDTEMAQKPAKVRSSRMYASDTILSYFRLSVRILPFRSPKSWTQSTFPIVCNFAVRKIQTKNATE